MQSEINSDKAEALLKWVNTINLSSHVNSLQELSNTKLLMEIVHLIDKDYQVEVLNIQTDNAKWLTKVVKYLEYFYQQPLNDFIDQNKITDFHNTLEIGKVLSLLLCCAVQGENVSECIDNITSLEENLQFQLKTVIEAVLKDLDNGKINSVNVTDVLIQTESFSSNVQVMNEEYQSSPIVMSPVSLYNSPIKALMASPQMQSRQSQLTISKLYKRLNQFQIKVNNLQRIQSDLEQQIEDKRKQIEEQELKIQTLSMKVTKVSVLEEEIESLARFETELDDANRKCERLRRSAQELEKYKEQFLQLEKDYSDLVANKETEKCSFEKCLKEVTNKNKDELESIQSLLDDSNKTCDHLRNKLQETLTVAETLKKELNEQRNLYVKETEKLKKNLAELKASKDKLCLKSDQDVLRQIAREAELKQCFREKETALQVSIDHLQLQNCELKRNVEELHMNLTKETEMKTNLKSSLALSESKLTEAICKYERLQSDFISLGDESKNTINKLQVEHKSLYEALQKTEADRQVHISQYKKTNEDLLGKSRCLTDELDAVKQKHLKLLKEKEEMRVENDNLCKENDSLAQENALIKTKLIEEEHFMLELKQLQDSSKTNMAEKDALLMENLKLKDNVRELQSVKNNVEELQRSLNLANQEKGSVIKDNITMKEQICNLEILVKELEPLQDHMTSMKGQLQTLKEEKLLLEKQVQQMNELSKEMSNLRNALKISNEEKHSFQEASLSLKDQIVKLEVDSEKYRTLQNRFDVLEEGALLLRKENADIIKQKQLLSTEAANLHLTLDEMRKQKIMLEERNSSLNKRIIEFNTQQQAPPQSVDLSDEMTALRNAMRISNEEKQSLQEINTSQRDELARRRVLCAEYETLQSSFEILKEEKTRLTTDKLLLVECNNSLKHDVIKNDAVLEEHKILQNDFNVVNEEKTLLKKENMELKNKIKHLESLPTNFSSCKEENGLLNSEVKRTDTSYNPPEYGSLKNSLEVIQAINTPDDVSATHVSKAQFHELLLSKFDDIIKEFKDGCKQDSQNFRHSGDDTATLMAIISECYASVVDQHTRNKNKTNDVEDCMKVKKIINEEPKTILNKINSNEEMNFKINELTNKVLLLEKENENLKEFQQDGKKEFLNERTKVEELEKNLSSCKAAMEKLNNNNVELELEMLSVQDQMKQLQKENVELNDYIPQVEEKVVDLEKKLSEEEFISKRLAVEVRSLEAQLAHADRQLREKLQIADNKMACHGSFVNQNNKTSANVRKKMSLVAEATSFETTSISEEFATSMEDSSVADNSVYSDVSLVSEHKDVTNNQEQKNQGSMLCNDEEHLSTTNTLCQQDVLKRLRRRSAVYSKKNSLKSEVNDKRRSTVGTESFVVGQFSNTLEDEPDQHDYEWDRIEELKKRNSICAVHLRSSYPVETQLRLIDEIQEEDLKLGGGSKTQSRKRLRDNISDSNVFSNVANIHCLPRSKSEIITKTGSKKSNEIHGENKHLTNSRSKQTSENLENTQQYNKRESVAFKVDITPAKKSRISLRPLMTRSSATEKETVANNRKVKPASKKLTLQRKSSSMKEKKKPVRTKRTNLAV